MVKRGAGANPAGRSNRKAKTSTKTARHAPRPERQSTGKPDQTSVGAKTPAQEPATRRASARTPTTNAPQAVADGPPASPGGFPAKNRMYRHGLGDCCLITLPRKTSPEPLPHPDRLRRSFSALRGKTPHETMTNVVEDIVHKSDGEIDSLFWPRISIGTICPASSRRRTCSSN